MLALFFERVKPASTNANPGCIKKTSIEARRTHTVSKPLIVIIFLTVLNVLFLVRQNGVPVLARTDRPGVIHRADENPSVPHFAGMGGPQDGVDSRLDELLAADDGDFDAGNDVRGVHHTPVNPVLPVLADGLHLRIGEPVDVGREERLFDLFEVRLTGSPGKVRGNKV